MDDHHKPTLSNLCEDVLLMISDILQLQRSEGETPLKNLATVNRRLRDVFNPSLFKSLCINRPVSQLCITPLIYHYGNTLKVDMFGSMWWWCSGSYVSSKDALELFACVQKMEHVKKLEVTMMKRSLDMFVSAFEEVDNARRFLLPGVETLVVTSAAAFLASHCPNLNKLVVEDAPSCSIETYIDVPSRLVPLHPQLSGGQRTCIQLTHLDTTANWSAEELAALMPVFPRLQSLHMRSDAFCYRASIATIVQLLGCGLRDLQTLRLNRISNLDMGFRAIWKRSVQSCVTEAQRKELWLQTEARRVEAENNVVRLAFTNIGRLKECWLGDQRVARRLITCSNHAKPSWLWERRREEFDNCAPGTEWANCRAEKESVIACSEVCM
jgi:hypothetical protein